GPDDCLVLVLEKVPREGIQPQLGFLLLGTMTAHTEILEKGPDNSPEPLLIRNWLLRVGTGASNACKAERHQPQQERQSSEKRHGNDLKYPHGRFFGFPALPGNGSIPVAISRSLNRVTCRPSRLRKTMKSVSDVSVLTVAVVVAVLVRSFTSVS